MTKADAISDYELARLENIRKNEEFLKSLGLFKDPAVAVVHDVLLKGRKQKIKRRSNSDENDDPDYVDFEKDTVPVRRSTRNSGVLVQHAELDPDGEPQLKRQKPEKRPYNPLKDAEEFFKNMGNSDDEKFEEDDEKKRVVLKPAEIRSYIESINPEHSDMISNTAINLCAYRCGYMSMAALKNRLKAISSGASKKSYEKLLVVSYTMRAMGLHRLAETAAGLLRTRTGLVLDWCPSGGTGGDSGDCGDSGDVGDVSYSGVDAAVDGSSGSGGGGDRSVKVEQDTVVKREETEPVDSVDRVSHSPSLAAEQGERKSKQRQRQQQVVKQEPSGPPSARKSSRNIKQEPGQEPREESGQGQEAGQDSKNCYW